jgi:hypothetical protein
VKLSGVDETTLPSAGGDGPLLTRHPADLNGPAFQRNLMSALSEDGLAAFGGIPDRAAFAHLARGLTALYPHPDGDPDGLTLLHTRDDGEELGKRGFSDAELLPHTERSCMTAPPHLLMLMCLAPGRHGGETLLIDGRSVAEDLARNEPESWRLLSGPGTAYFGGAAGHAGSIFEPIGSGRWTIRLRLDGLVRFAPQALPHVVILRKAIDRHTKTLLLEPGQGFVLDNTRWLHGRRPFQGPRTMLRALGEPRECLPLDRGFPVLLAALAALERTTGNEWT